MGIYDRPTHPKRFPTMANLRDADEPSEMVLHGDRVGQPTATTCVLRSARGNVPAELCTGGLGRV